MSLLSRLAVRAARAYGMLAAGSATNVSADYLVVAGGGGAGGQTYSGGGGGGGFRTSTATLSTLNTYSITVGAGGANGTTGLRGTSGSDSVLSGTGLTTITSTGGGGGGAGDNNATEKNGRNGGSGGGGASDQGSSTGTGGTGNTPSTSPSQGNNGGTGGTDGATFRAGGGGGGASAVGANNSSGAGGAGGAGTASSISGSSVTYAGGGGGGGNSSSGAGGAGGGGGLNTAGTANTGGGGGGTTTGTPGAGGSGIVIISYTSATPKFVGGTITTSGGKQIHTFTSSGTLSPITPITASYLVVAGGGGSARQLGGYAGNGGGGAGGLLSGSTTIYSGATYVVTVGAGGAGGTTSGVAPSGSNSVLSGTGLTTLTSTGGGGGGGSTGTGANGGSGGGGSGELPRTAGTGTSGQGNNGGAGVNAGGGGGGAGAAGSVAVTITGGAGGIGTQSSISGTATYYAGGGGGGAYSSGTAGTGGSGGGGNGGAGASNTGNTPGTANTGGGAGGTAGDPLAATNGQTGGSGIVIISYAGSQVFNGGLVTTSGGNTIHTFTSTGALTPLTNNLTNSLRFRKSASAFLSRTPTATGSQQKFTLSTWVKLGSFATGADSFIWASADNAASGVNPSLLWKTFTDSYKFLFDLGTGGLLTTTQVFRDPSAWYHIVINADTTQATASNRLKMYINGNQVTAFSSETYPTQNTNILINTPSYPARIGGVLLSSSTDRFFDGYMADINFIDGQALEPYYFGNNDANGVWKPIQYKGTYGTNGFYLTFGNTTSTTTLGYDSSPNGNNWTCNNISLTAGTTYDAMTDVPTNTSATVANYAVMNPLWKDGTTVIAQGNLDVSNGNYGGFSTLTIPTNSKFYAEFTVTATQGNQGVGILKAANAYSGVISQADMFGSNSVTYYSTNGNKFVLGGGSTAYGSSWGTIGDVIGIAVNTVDNQITFYKNNTSQGVITGLTSGIEWVFATGNQTNTGGGAWNFGQRPFSYTPPTGFVALNTFNLPTPTILQGNKYMDATLYSGNNVGQVVVNQGQFRPDFLWIKVRTNTYDHTLADSVRGVSAFLASNTTAAEGTNSELTSFNSNGFTLGATGSMARNVSGQNYVGWQWQAGQGSTSSNTSGSITSTVSVNTTAGFSIVTYTGTGANATVGHGLGVAPKFIIVKKRSAADPWVTYHVSLGVQYYTIINETSASYNNLADYWSATAPSSTVFGLNSYGGNNQSAATYVAYCWAEIAGFSKFGSYTGNGSSDGPFVYLGFRPRWVMWKNSSAVSYWWIMDSSIDPYNPNIYILAPNANIAEYTDSNLKLDFLSNGFKPRTLAGNEVNGSGNTIIYAAFAENPFKNANAR